MESLDSRLDKARVTSRMLGLLGSRLCLAARVECIYHLILTTTCLFQNLP